MCVQTQQRVVRVVAVVELVCVCVCLAGVEEDGKLCPSYNLLFGDTSVCECPSQTTHKKVAQPHVHDARARSQKITVTQQVTMLQNYDFVTFIVTFPFITRSFKRYVGVAA